jgi:hypothetical protein
MMVRMFMVTRDLEQLEVLNRIKEKHLKKSIAAQILDISLRLVRRQQYRFNINQFKVEGSI